jgi:hypothetical protein
VDDGVGVVLVGHGGGAVVEMQVGEGLSALGGGVARITCRERPNLAQRRQRTRAGRPLRPLLRTSLGQVAGVERRAPSLPHLTGSASPQPYLTTSWHTRRTTHHA